MKLKSLVNETEAHQWRSERVREFQNKENGKIKEANDPQIKPIPGACQDLYPVYDMPDFTSWSAIDSSHQDAEEIATKMIRASALPVQDQVDGPCRQARELFFAGIAGKLIEREASKDQLDQLDQLFVRAKNLSLNIWARKSNIICAFTKQLEDEVYAADSRRIVAHELFLDDRFLLQDKRFSVLVHPLLEVYGTEEGCGYATGRVLTPAVAWYLPV